MTLPLRVPAGLCGTSDRASLFLAVCHVDGLGLGELGPGGLGLGRRLQTGLPELNLSHQHVVCGLRKVSFFLFFKHLSQLEKLGEFTF